MSMQYHLDEIVKSYKWLGHKGRGYTELIALHTDYKPGDNKWNSQHEAYPKIWYSTSAQGVVEFVKRYASNHIVCYGINPRPKSFKNKNGYVRSVLDNEIQISQNILFDFDFINKKVTEQQKESFHSFLGKVDQYFKDLGLMAPIKAFTGRGYHLLFAYPPIKVEEHSDIREKLKEFRRRFIGDHKRDLENLEVKLDSTYDLRRVVRIYGTAKPDVNIPSRFFGQERIEDAALREYLLQLPISHLSNGYSVTSKELPIWFNKLLEADPQLYDLWNGVGKPGNTDQSKSGFDYSLVKRLMWLGHKNLDELATILALRPNGSVQGSGKNEQYVWRTIASALIK